MRTHLLVVATLFLTGVARGALTQTSPTSDVQLPKITIASAEGMPVQLESASFAVDGGQSVARCMLINTADDALLQVELTLVVFDAVGKRRGWQVNELSSDLPIEAHGKRAVSLPVATVSVEPTDQVRLGVSAAATSGQGWTNRHLLDEPDLRSRRPDVVVLNPDDAPAALVDVGILRRANWTPELVRLIVENRSPESLMSVRVAVFVFTAEGGLMLQSNMESMVPLAPRGQRPHVYEIHDVRAKPDWKVVVAIAEAATATQKWVNDNLRAKAEASVRQPPGH
jgi:hypothetical protein